MAIKEQASRIVLATEITSYKGLHHPFHFSIFSLISISLIRLNKPMLERYVRIGRLLVNVYGIPQWKNSRI